MVFLKKPICPDITVERIPEAGDIWCNDDTVQVLILIILEFTHEYTFFSKMAKVGHPSEKSHKHLAASLAHGPPAACDPARSSCSRTPPCPPLSRAGR